MNLTNQKTKCFQSKEVDELHEECGVFGVYNAINAEGLAYYGIHSLQHRGQGGFGSRSV
ncbi:MAG: hypothetical protein ACRC0A_02300 [Chitinophagaceae bacterium]